MSKWAARLAAITEKRKSQMRPVQAPSKPSKAPFEPFEGDVPEHILENHFSESALQENIDERAANDTPLPARVRQRFRDCCTRLGIESEPILRQFDYWKYTARDLQDMDAWPVETIETHTRLLLSETKGGLP